MIARNISRVAYSILAVASLAYILLTLWRPLPPAANTYHLSMSALHGLQLTIILPVILVWFVALYGSLKFKDYSLRIADSKDGRALNTTSTGLLVLVTSLVLTTLAQTISTWNKYDTHIIWSVISNYIGVVGPLIAFWLIYQGSVGLARMVSFKGVSRQRWVIIAGLIPISALYIWVVLHDPYRTYSPDPERLTSYFMPDLLIFLTIIIPYIVTWYVGLLAAIQLKAYQAYSNGIIYKSALSGLSNGLVAVIGSSLILQMLAAMGPAFSHWGLNSILGLLYVVIAIYALGHVWILAGARRLAKIEEVV